MVAAKISGHELRVSNYIQVPGAVSILEAVALLLL